MTEKIVREHGSLSTLVKTGTGLIKNGAGHLYWVTMNGGAGNTRIELSNDADGGGAMVYAINCLQNCAVHVVLDPPMEFDTGIYLKTYTSAADVIFGYT